MSLPDMAEYWQDVKRNPYKPTYTHIEGFDCGHFHVHESIYDYDIDCKACQKAIAQGNVAILFDDPPWLRKINAKKKAKRDALGKQFGYCICGAPFIERENSSNGKKFLGCSTYPKCKNTKSL